MTAKYELIKSIHLEITTGKSRKSGTDEQISLQVRGNHWLLDMPKYDDFEPGKTDFYYLDKPESMDLSWFRFLCFQKKSTNWKE